MFNESTIDSFIDDGVITSQNIDIMFSMLDIVGVSALWVDRNFEHFKFNKSNKFLSDASSKRAGKLTSYKDLVNDINIANNLEKRFTENWMNELIRLQSVPYQPQENHVVLSHSGKRFLSRRVFLDDGSMLVVGFDYMQLRKREDLAKVAFHLSKSGVSCFTLATKETIVESPYLERILTSEELRKVKEKTLLAIVHPDEVESSKDIFKWSLRSSISLTKNIRIKTEKNGILWFKFTGRMEKDENNIPFQHILSFEDITEELKIQEDLRSLIDESNEKHEKQINFMAELSHELKTPMNAIVGISDALLYNENVSESVREKLELIQSASEQLVDMLDETLDHAKLSTEHAMLNLEYVDARKSIGEICQLWENQALKKGTIIRFKADENLPQKVKLDEKKIGQCLNNLISNAAKFTEYGYIDIVVKAHKSSNQPEKLAIIVRDNGIGMTEEQQGKIFDAYQQADKTISSRFGGTGLGMSITKDFIQLMGGKITVKSESGKGTIFLILLPLMSGDNEAVIPQISVQEQQHISSPPIVTAATKSIQPQEQPPEQGKTIDLQTDDQQADHADHADDWQVPTPLQNIFSDTAIDAKALKKLNILVVDDNETNHIVLSSILENIVGKIYSAHNGQEALDVLAVEHIDIVLMDIHMPVMDGIEATIAIRQNSDLYPPVRIIALTADPQYQQKRLCVNIGMDEAIAKPVKLVDLLETMKKTLAAPINQLNKAAS